VGGHCIPCDPYYLLWQLGKHDRSSPLIEQAMSSIALRPARVVERAGDVLAGHGRITASIGTAIMLSAMSWPEKYARNARPPVSAAASKMKPGPLSPTELAWNTPTSAAPMTALLISALRYDGVRIVLNVRRS